MSEYSHSLWIRYKDSIGWSIGLFVGLGVGKYIAAYGKVPWFALMFITLVVGVIFAVVDHKSGVFEKKTENT